MMTEDILSVFNDYDPLILVEVGIIFLIILIQIAVYLKNRGAISKLRNVYPEEHKLSIDFVSLKAKVASDLEEEEEPLPEEDPSKAEAHKLTVLKEDRKYSTPFTQIVQATNSYVVKNKGGVSFPALESIASKKVSSMEEAIEPVVPLTLYLGLLGTFAGVIIGLVKIAMVGVSDPAIQSFVGGVLVGMIASAFGLFLTVRTNYHFKEARKKCSQGQYSYFNFIRLNLLPASAKALPGDFKTLRYNLSSFNDEFISYQQSLNNSLSDTLQRFEELQDVFGRIRDLEGGLGNITQFLRNNQALMERQASHLTSVTQKTEQLTTQIGQRIEGMDTQVRTLAERGGVQPVLEGAEVAVAYPETSQNGALNGRILEQMEENEAVNRQIANQLSNINAFLQKALSEEETSKKMFLNSFAFKFFTFIGTLAGIAGLVAGVHYIIQNMVP